MKLISRLSLIASLSATLCFTAAAGTAVKPSALFSDHMVLQSGTLVPVWGSATPGEKVAVTLNGQTRSATADARAGTVHFHLQPRSGEQPKAVLDRGLKVLHE